MILVLAMACSLAFMGAAQAASQLSGLMQDFDGGGSTFTGVQHLGAPAPSVTAGGPTGSFLRIANDGVGGQNNTVAFDVTGTGPFDFVELKFDFRIGGAGNGADGMGIALLNTANFGTVGGLGSFFSEEANLAGSFGIGIDTHDNGGGDVSEDSVTLHWNGAQVGEVDLTGTMDLENNLFNRALLSINPVAGGSNVTLSFIDDVNGAATDVAVFTDFFIAGLSPYEARLAFSARTGGLNDNHDIDNVMATFAIPEPGTAVLAFLSVGALGLRRRRVA